MGQQSMSDGLIRDFLALEKPDVEGMSDDDIRAEVEGWRTVISMLPREVFEWLARIHEPIRFIKRNYQGHVGVLLGVTFEPVEYVLGLDEAVFDSLRGQRMVESKQLTIPANAVMYFEAIYDARQYDPSADDEELGEMSLEHTEANNG